MQLLISPPPLELLLSPRHGECIPTAAANAAATLFELELLLLLLLLLLLVPAAPVE